MEKSNKNIPTCMNIDLKKTSCFLVNEMLTLHVQHLRKFQRCDWSKMQLKATLNSAVIYVNTELVDLPLDLKCHIEVLRTNLTLKIV